MSKEAIPVSSVDIAWCAKHCSANWCTAAQHCMCGAPPDQCATCVWNCKTQEKCMIRERAWKPACPYDVDGICAWWCDAVGVCTVSVESSDVRRH